MSKTLNHSAFSRSTRYISGGIYAHAYNGVPPTRNPSAPNSWDAATPVAVHLKIVDLACKTRHYRPPTTEVHPDNAPLLRDTPLATGYFVTEHILTAKGDNTPQTCLLPVPAPTLRANTKSSATIGPATLPIRDSQSPTKTSMSTDPIPPVEIYATTHSPFSASRRMGRVDSQGASGISPSGIPTPFWPPKTLDHCCAPAQSRNY